MSGPGPIFQSEKEAIVENPLVSATLVSNPIAVGGYSQVALLFSVQNYAGLSNLDVVVEESFDGQEWYRSEDYTASWTKAIIASERWVWNRSVNSLWIRITVATTAASGEDFRLDVYKSAGAMAGSSNGGAPPVPGSLTIQDEGGTICTNVTTINYVGSDVLAVCDSPGVVNVYIPPPAYDSHWNTDDGANGGQWVSESISRHNAHISDPNAQGNPFNTAGWEDTVRQACLQNTMTFTTPSTTTGFGGDSIAQVTVYDADGSILDAFSTANLTADGSYGAGRYTVSITGYAVDGPRFKAHMSISVDVAGVLADAGLLSGRIHVVAIHKTDSGTDDGNNYAYVQNDVFLDDNSATPQINGTVTISETVGNVLTKHLSGLEYYILNSLFTAGVTDIDNLNKDTSRVDGNLLLYAPAYGLPNLSHSPHGTGAANFIGWTNLYSQQDVDYQITSWAITDTNFRYVGDGAVDQSRPQDTWGQGVLKSSAADEILVDTYPVNSQDLVELFDDEARRQDSGFNGGNFSGNWDSTQSLNAGEAMVFNGQIMHPDAATLFSTSGLVNLDWSTYMPNLNGPNPDYTPLAAQTQVEYNRTFRDSSVNGGPLTGQSRSSGQFVFTGTFVNDAAQDLANSEIEIYLYKMAGIGNTGAPPANTTPLLMHGAFYNFAIFDDGNTNGQVRQATSSGNVIDFTFGGYNMEDGIFTKIVIKNKNIRIDSIHLTLN